MNRGPVAEINLGAISNNLNVVRSLSQGRPVIAVVKADAYGHGAVEVSRRLSDLKVEYLSVAFTEEAKELRDSGINLPILVLFDPDIRDILQYNLIPVVRDKKTALAISKEAERANVTIGVHIKVDTGMGRLGLTEDADREILDIANLKGLHIDGVMSHFSDSDLCDSPFAKVQIERFNVIRKVLSDSGLHVKLFHMANSAAVINLPESHFDAVRPGLMLYGYSPMLPIAEDVKPETINANSELIPAMTIKTKILAIRRLPANTPISYSRTFITKRDSLIGVIPLGYADNFSRRFSNNAEMLVKGKRVKVAGRVCMDLTMVDLTDLKDVSEGDEVVIIGSQGDERITVYELAQRADTIPYEIVTSLGGRTRKLYIN